MYKGPNSWMDCARTLENNWLGDSDIDLFFQLSGFSKVKSDRRILLPYNLLGLGKLINRYIAPLPFFCLFCLRFYTVARIIPRGVSSNEYSTSIVIPCRNEKDNIELAVRRIPAFCNQIEMEFIVERNQLV